MKNLIRPTKLPSLFVAIFLVLTCFALSPQARAVCQEGCLTNNNTVLGDDALLNNSGFYNTAIGFEALLNNTSSQNTAVGFEALLNNTGCCDTAIGMNALFSNTTGSLNTASGDGALSANTTGTLNTANGSNALAENTTGSGNTATGQDALVGNTTGNGNIALGWSAGSNVTTGSNNIEIGSRGVAGDAKTIRIGKQGTQTTTFIAGVSGATVPTGVGVIIDSTGHLGTSTSSARFKEAIRPMDKTSEAILVLKPVTFRYKHELDPEGIPQFGLVAEDVEKVNTNLVAGDEQGKPYTVRYEAVNAMLLNEFLKEHREVQEQKATIAEFKKEIANLTATVKQQSGQIQKVSAQLEASKPAPHMVVNNH